MNGRGNGFNLSSRSIPNGTNRAVPNDVLFPSGSNMSPLSNANYFANITKAGNSPFTSFSGQPQSTGRQEYVQRLDSARSPPSYNDSGVKRLMPQGYNSLPSAEKAAQGITSTTGVEAGVGAVSSIRSMALSAGGMAPVAAAAQAAQQIGQGIGSTFKVNDESKANQDFVKNSQVASVGNSANASLIRNVQQDTINKNYNAAMIGSLFGPLGALAGHFVSSLANSQETPTLNVGSFGQGVDPADSGINRSLNTTAATGKSEMTDSINGN